MSAPRRSSLVLMAAASLAAVAMLGPDVTPRATHKHVKTRKIHKRIDPEKVRSRKQFRLKGIRP